MNVKANKWLSQAITGIPPNRPLIFWDTCSIIDLSRVIERDTYDDYHRIERIVAAIENGEITSVTSELVVSEYQKNIIEVDDKRGKIVKDICNTIDKIAQIIAKETTIQKLHSASKLINVENEIHSLVSRLWKKTVVIKDSRALQKMAHERTLREDPPSKNKSQYKDCFIWCTYICLIKRLDEAAPQSIFITSNTSDYGEGQKNSTPHHHLISEAKVFNGDLIFTIGQLYGKLKDLGVPSMQ